MNILGISGQDRDAAAALVRDGSVLAAIEEEKLSRIRHIGMTYAGGLPLRAIDFCLERGGIEFEGIDYIAYYTEPWQLARRTTTFRVARAFSSPIFPAIRALPYYVVDTLNSLRQRRRTMHLAVEKTRGHGRFVAVNHQKAHAASAFYPSGFERAAVLVAGNVGDVRSTALMTGSGANLKLKGQAAFPNSIGMVYSSVTEALGFEPGDDHKTMWLSPTGENEFAELFSDLLKVGPDGLPKVNLAYFDSSFKGGAVLSERFFNKVGLKPRGKDGPINGRHRNVAASLQTRVDDVMVEMASRLREATKEESLCLAGGVALNSFANTAVEKRSGFNRIFVQPAAGNAGCSIGAALYVWHETLGNSARNYEMRDPFLGPRFGEEEVKQVLDNCKLAYEYFLTEDKLVSEVASLLAQGQIVGWFRGPMEFGPRALGARSILASPINELTADNLNTFVKHREEFRPFSSSVPEERAAEFFEPSGLTEFMQVVCKIRPEKLTDIPASVFGAGLARVHTVSKGANRTFWKLLTKFGELTSVPVLVNTSFNLFGEPVVSTPREAVRGFYCSGIDCLVVENFLVKK